MAYNTGLFGETRDGVGAFYFDSDREPSTFYVDLSGTSGLGTSVSPWSYQQCVNYLDPTLTTELSNETPIDGDIVKIKNSIVVVDYKLSSGQNGVGFVWNHEDFGGKVTLESWDVSSFGHWGIESSGSTSDFECFFYNNVSGGYEIEFKDFIYTNIYNNSNVPYFAVLKGNTSNVSASFKNFMITSGEGTVGTADIVRDDPNSSSLSNGNSLIQFFGGNVYKISFRENLIGVDIDFYDCVILSAGQTESSIEISNLSAISLTNCVTQYNLSAFSSAGVTLSGTEGSYTFSKEFPIVDRLSSFDANDFIYSHYGIDISSSNALWISESYDYGILGTNRNGIGYFYFTSVSGLGHIGAFYFGPVDETLLTDLMEVSAVLLVPTVTVSAAVSGTVTPTVWQVRTILLQPTIYAFKDLEVDFVGVPRSGVSPLTVDFTAIVKWSPGMRDKYRVKEYIWCFDYDYTNNICKENWVTTDQNPITHVYTGYRGQKFTPKVCVTLELIT